MSDAGESVTDDIVGTLDTEEDPGEIVLAANPEDPDAVEVPEGDAGTDTDATDPDSTDTFSREYVTNLRREAASHRAKTAAAEERAESLARSLWNERVASLKLLADPTDLPFDAAVLDDADAIRKQADDLLAKRPHLRTRRILDRAGQGEGTPGATVSLSEILRAGA